jgi:hypothetical protein
LVERKHLREEMIALGEEAAAATSAAAVVMPAAPTSNTI